jgi:replicative DNA helicase
MISVEDILTYFILTEENQDEVLTSLQEYHFKNNDNRAVFKAAKELKTQGRRIDTRTLSEFGISPKTIAKFYSFDIPVSDLTRPVQFYIEDIIKNNIESALEKLLRDKVVEATMSGEWNEIATEILKAIPEILDTGIEDDKMKSIQEIAKEERNAYYIREQAAKEGKLSGLPTGIGKLDKFSGGFQPEFIILAARPGMGKTAMSLFHACNMNEEGIYFNLEMNNSQLCQRFILQFSQDRIESWRLRDGKLTDGEKLVMEQSIATIEKQKVYVYDKARLGLNELTRVARRMHRKGKCKWIIVDYLQLLTVENGKFNNSEAEVGYISRNLKALQKELGIPLIALAQLNRDCDKRPDKKPLLSDLRSSGSIEQDADTVFMIYRPKEYNLNDEDGTPYENDIFYLCEKHRQGSTGSVHFYHNQTMTSFFDEKINASTTNLSNSTFKPMSNFYETDKMDF